LQTPQLTAQPFPHDTGNLPWVIVAAYGLAAILAAMAAFGAEARSERRFWVIATVGLLFLGINKQLDLQTHLSDFFREVARRGGWYKQRRPLQVAFIALDALIGLGIGIYLMRLAVAAGAGVRIAMIGLVLLGAYIVLRAASFHHVDSLLGRMVNHVKVHNYVELSCILVVIVGAALSTLLHRHRHDSERSPMDH
jgi:hypothetical protein